MNKGQRYTKAFSRIKDSIGNSSAISEDLDTINWKLYRFLDFIGVYRCYFM